MGDGGAEGFDPAAVRAKYLAERDKRLIPGRADIRDLSRDEHFARYRDDPFTAATHRDPVHDDVDVVIVGGGIAGLVAGAQLRKAGIERIRILDQAGGFGGTWYWNRYPGVMCDVESYMYMPMLEELGYVPTTRYAFGEEIRLHLEAIGDHFDLRSDALFHTGVTGAEWDEAAARWRIHTDRDDEVTCRYYVLAVGLLNLLKLPAVSGMEDFAGPSFHTARWDYDVTGGAPGDPDLTKLGDKVVGPHRHRRDRHPVPAPAGGVGQARGRVPAHAVGGRRARQPTHRSRLRRRLGAGLAAGPDGQLPGDHARPEGRRGSRRRRVDAPLRGGPPPAEGGHPRGVHARRRGARLRDHGGAPPPSGGAGGGSRHGRDPQAALPVPVQAPVLPRRVPERVQQRQRHPRRLSRPASTRVTEKGPVVDGHQYEVDVLIYGTGFEPEVTPLYRRAGHPIVGRDGLSLAEKWEPGAATLFGMMTRGFPNLFVMPAPAQQCVVTVNYTQLAVLGAEFIGGAVRHPRAARREGVRRERRGRGGLDAEDRRLVRRRQRRHVAVHAVPHQPGGQPGVAEPAQRQLRPRLR